MTITITDMFCGAGGSSLGATFNEGVELRMALNHWTRAIETHNTNFPEAGHDCADVSQVNPRRYPKTDILLASPECTNHSLAKGARRRTEQAASLWDDGPGNDTEAQKSRATMWDVPRFAEVHRYKAIVVENVVDAFKWGPDDNGTMFDAWLNTMDALGYERDIVFLNSMFAGAVPQSRDRMYVVFWQKGIRRPDLRVTPPSWCPACERVVEGQQTWKRPDRRPWGRYGPQYVYGCPTCHGIAIPGALPASHAIDWTIEADRIGDRARPLAAATRARIQRGLQRLATEPFAIGTPKGGQPRPMTLPLVPVTGPDHDAAMVLPVAGNTFERTPGNRARRTDTQPFPTVHGTAEQSLVYVDRSHTIPRLANREPSGTACASANHLGVVVSNYGRAGGKGGGWARDASLEPIGTVTTTDGHALLVPYYSNGEGSDAVRAPSPTLTTRDRVALAWGDADIDACRFRMFDLAEIARTMAMDSHADGTEYVVTGNKRERMAQYGNAVTPPAMRLLVSRLQEVLD